MQYSFDTIGVIHSCFKEKFGIPRQPGLVQEARAELELLPPYNRPEALRELEGFSHIWVLFVFHGVKRQAWKPTVRPPRLGGNQRVGVFASRSTHRPNPIGMSVVALEGIEQRGERLFLQLSGVDLMDGTPVLDIKPYLPYADALPQARGGFAPEPQVGAYEVLFSPEAESACQSRAGDYPHLHAFIEEILRHDPRPAYVGDEGGERVFGMRLFDFDLRWRVEGETIHVLALAPLDE